MLPSKHRLRKDEVGEVFKRGSRAANQYGSASFLKHTQLKVAVVVSKKIAHSAVARNKIRRRVYTAVQKLSPSIIPTHLVILPNQKLIAAKSPELVEGISHLLKKAKILIS